MDKDWENAIQYRFSSVNDGNDIIVILTGNIAERRKDVAGTIYLLEQWPKEYMAMHPECKEVLSIAMVRLVALQENNG